MSKADRRKQAVAKAIRKPRQRKRGATSGHIITKLHGLDALSNGNVQASDGVAPFGTAKVVPLPCGSFMCLDSDGRTLGVGMPPERERPCPQSAVGQLARLTLAIRHVINIARIERAADGELHEHLAADLARALHEMDSAYAPFWEEDIEDEVQSVVSDEGEVVEDVRTRNGVSSDGTPLPRGNDMVHSQVRAEGDDD